MIPHSPCPTTHRPAGAVDRAASGRRGAGRRPVRRRRIAALVAAVMACALPAAAQDERGVTFTLGAGAGLVPYYFGADRYTAGPTGRFALHNVRLPGGLEIGSPQARPLDPGFRIGGAFRYIRARGAGDNPELAGLDRVDAAVELGLRARHVSEYLYLFADLRHGVVGHRGWAADLGADALLRVTPGLTLSAGPRASFGDARFTRTYFGVTPAESAASGFAAFRPSEGLVSVGAELGLRLAMDDNWSLIGTLSYDRLRDEAGRSPITAQGSRDQWGARLVVTRRFNLQF